MADAAPRKSRSTFGPVVLAGLAFAALCAVAGHRAWAVADGGDARSEALGKVVAQAGTGVGESPAAGAAALVLLASWGVLLVTRGRVRRVVAGVAVLATAGFLAAVVVGFNQVPDGVRDALSDLGADDPAASRTAWYWIALVAGLASLAATLKAFVLVPGWPEMGAKYDAPAGGEAAPAPVVPLDEQSSLDLWKAMDEGHDPTA